MEDQSQAISLANSYFSLVDGLAPGLENHLAEDVVLDWFGRTIRGRKNVTEFMKSHCKVGSRHIFNSIAPVNCINYRKSQTNRKIYETRKTEEDRDGFSQLTINRELNFEKLSINDSPVDPENNNIVKGGVDRNYLFDMEQCRVGIFNSDVNGTEEIGAPTIYELGENDLENLFASEIKPTRREEIEENIKDLMNMTKNGGEMKKRQEEKEPATTNLFADESVRSKDNDHDRRQEESSSSICAGGNGTIGNGWADTTIKYVEAIGQIEFSKKSNKRKTATGDLQKWKRHTNLQIAYSVTTDANVNINRGESFHEIMETDGNFVSPPPATSDQEIPRSLLPSLVEIAEISSRLIPNENNFGGYLDLHYLDTAGSNFATERDKFLQNFNAQLSTVEYNVANAAASLRICSTPRYVDDRLIFPEIIHNYNHNNISSDCETCSSSFSSSSCCCCCCCSSMCSRDDCKPKKIEQRENDDADAEVQQQIDDNRTRNNKHQSARKNIRDAASPTGFVFNYLIRIIIYQGNTKCRRSLTQEFDCQTENNNNYNHSKRFSRQAAI